MADAPTTRSDHIPYPRILSRADGLLALVASKTEERQLRGEWTPLPMPSEAAYFASDMVPKRERLGGLFVTQGRPVFLRIVSQYDIGLDAVIYRLDVWMGPL